MVSIRAWHLFSAALLVSTSSCGSLISWPRLERRDNNGTNPPPPVEIPASGKWEGNDGPWSTHNFRVGTPAQICRLLIATDGQTTISVIPDGCNSTDPVDCKQRRGGPYIIQNSTTWTKLSSSPVYKIDLDHNLGFGGDDDQGLYGYDTVGFGLADADGPTVDKMVTVGIATKDFFLGMAGVGPRPLNVSDYNTPIPSLFSTLYSNNIIPSISWSYTAGALYAQKGGQAGQFVYGGYDTSRFNSDPSHSMSFTFAPDDSRELVVGLQAINTKDADGSNGASLLSKPIYSFIESTNPQIWLPIDACQAFEKAFGLVYNDTLKLYPINDTVHDNLTKRNPSVTFTLANGLGSGPSITITLPYAAFDLTLSWPIVPDGQNQRYFPLKRADNDTQYTLGRTFLQEAYLTADYERKNFTVSQAVFSTSAPKNLLPIYSTAYVASHPVQVAPQPTTSSGIGAGAIAGIVVAVVVLLIILLFACCWAERTGRIALWKKKRNERRTAKIPELPGDQPVIEKMGTERKAELSPDPLKAKSEMYASSGAHETYAGESAHEIGAGNRDSKGFYSPVTVSPPMSTVSVVSPPTAYAPSPGYMMAELDSTPRNGTPQPPGERGRLMGDHDGQPMVSNGVHSPQPQHGRPQDLGIMAGAASGETRDTSPTRSGSGHQRVVSDATLVSEKSDHFMPMEEPDRHAHPSARTSPEPASQAGFSPEHRKPVAQPQTGDWMRMPRSPGANGFPGRNDEDTA